MPASQPLLTQPRNPGELLDEAALLVRATFSQSLRAVLIGYLPWSILGALPMVPTTIKLSSGIRPLPEEMAQHLTWLAVHLVVDIVLLRQFVRGWLFAIAGAELRGMRVTSGEAAWHGFRRLPSAAIATLLTTGFLGGILIAATSMASQDPATIGVVMISIPALLLVGLPLAILGYVTVAVVQLERRGPFASLARSVRLCWPGMGTVLVMVAVLTIIRCFSGLLPALATNLWMQTALQSTVAGFLIILDVAIEAVLYFTLRCRREDYDLELMSREVELWNAEEVESTAPSFDRDRFTAGHTSA